MDNYQQNFLSSLAGGYQFGQQIKKQRDNNQLNQLAQTAYAAPPEQQQALIGQAMGIDRTAGAALEKQAATSEEQRTTSMVNMAKMLMSVPPEARQGLYDNRMLPALRSLGVQAPQWSPESEPIIMKSAQDIYSASMGGGQTPTDVRSFQMMTKGMSPEDIERARRINLGLDGRASSSGFTAVKFTGPDGRERVGSFNGRTGQIDLPDGTSFNPQTGALSQTAGMPQGAAQPSVQATVFRAPNGEVIDVSQITEPGLRESIMQNAGQWGLVPDGGSAQLPARNVSPAQAGGGMFVGRAPEEQAAATEAAKLGVQAQYLPQELQARTQAALAQKAGEAQVSAQADQATRDRSNSSASQVYETGMSGVYEGMRGTDTGPIAGRLPAVTTGQQIAQGATAAMAPVLKQMFRTAGEGTFTDKDQDLLMQMVPTRTDTPAAREAKMANVDNIVRAKLGMPPPKKAVNPQTGETLYLRFGQWVKK
jgi:hypothetical protein